MSEQESTAPSEEQRRRQVLKGIVRSDKMDKTVVVEVSQRVLHKGYKKYVNRRRRYMAHDESNECKAGDSVRIISTRPLSSRKRWRVLELVERAR